jgi:hypothetical protein
VTSRWVGRDLLLVGPLLMLRTCCGLLPRDSRLASISPAVLQWRRTSWPVSRVLSTGSRSDRTAIHLRLPLPTASSGLPGSSGGPPSNASCLTLLRVGFAEPPESPRTLVGSYPTVSPLPDDRGRRAVCSLWHCPAGHPGSVLPTTLPFGARTFLGGASKRHRRDRPANSSAGNRVRPTVPAGQPATASTTASATASTSGLTEGTRPAAQHAA